MAGKACDYDDMPSNAGNGTKTMAKKASARGGNHAFVRGGKKGRRKKSRRK